MVTEHARIVREAILKDTKRYLVVSNREDNFEYYHLPSGTLHRHVGPIGYWRIRVPRTNIDLDGFFPVDIAGFPSRSSWKAFLPTLNLDYEETA